MDWTPTQDQQKALKGIDRLARSGQAGDFIIINGWCGTGKTTMLGYAIKAMDQDSIVVTPTGKSALRVREATQHSAHTIHSWLYHPHETPEGVKFTRRDADNIMLPASRILFVDEASMVSKELWRDIREVAQLYGLRIVLVGDSFQLPPVTKDSDQPFSVLELQDQANETLHLNEVTRQALDSPIVRASVDIREDRVMEGLHGQGIPVTSNPIDKAMETGVVICHRNATRHTTNNTIRGRLGRHGDLVPGEPLSVTANNYRVELLNGEIVEVERWVPCNPPTTGVFDFFHREAADVHLGSIKLKGMDRSVIGCAEQIFGTLSGRIGTRALEQGSKMVYGEDRPFLHTNLGYCLTAHRAQGSEWPEGVVMIEPSIRLHTLEGRRWIYTSIGRFSRQVWISYT